MGRIFSMAVLLAVVSVQMQAQNEAPQGSTGTSSANTSTSSPGETKSKTDDGQPTGSGDNKKPDYDKKSLEVLTGVGAVLAGVEATSYKVDTTNNALSQTNVGRKTIEILLGGGFILPWHKGGGWIERSFWSLCSRKEEADAKAKAKAKEEDAKAEAGKPKAEKKPCGKGGDADYENYRPYESFLVEGSGEVGPRCGERWELQFSSKWTLVQSVQG
jgi:hypothetical protein